MCFHFSKNGTIASQIWLKGGKVAEKKIWKKVGQPTIIFLGRWCKKKKKKTAVKTKEAKKPQPEPGEKVK